MSKTDLEYFVTTSDMPAGLDENVNERLQEGWALQGGVSVVMVRQSSIPGPEHQDFWATWAQAMVRETPSKLTRGWAG